MNKILLALAIAVPALFASELVSASGDYTIYGSGTMSCGKWTDYNADGRDYRSASWLSGYMTGIGTLQAIAGTAELESVDPEALWSWMDNYCKANPLIKVNDAAWELVIEILSQSSR